MSPARTRSIPDCTMFAYVEEEWVEKTPSLPGSGYKRDEDA